MKNAAKSDQALRAFGKLVDEHVAEQALAAVTRAIEKDHDDFTDYLAMKLSAFRRTAAADGDSTATTPGEWIGIESLSRLRSVVGGRFQNLKKKWIDAGLPLREHRGDRWKDFEMSKDGWLELSQWIAKQGFEARLAAKDSDFLFELRPLGSK